MPRPAPTLPSELPVFTRYYDLFVWSFQRSEGFPKVLRPTLTQRFSELLLGAASRSCFSELLLGAASRSCFSELLLGALEELLELRYTRERAALFGRVNLTLEKLRVLSRALKDRRALSLTQYEFFNKELNEVGRMVGGWMKANARKSAESMS